MPPLVLPQQWKGLQKTMTASFHLLTGKQPAIVRRTEKTMGRKRGKTMAVTAAAASTSFPERIPDAALGASRRSTHCSPQHN